MYLNNIIPFKVHFRLPRHVRQTNDNTMLPGLGVYGLLLFLYNRSQEASDIDNNIISSVINIRHAEKENSLFYTLV